MYFYKVIKNISVYVLTTSPVDYMNLSLALYSYYFTELVNVVLKNLIFS